MAQNKEKKAVKKAVREAEKAAKKNPKVFLAIVAFVLVVAIIAGACWYFFVYRKQSVDDGAGMGTNTTQSGTNGSDGTEKPNDGNEKPNGGTEKPNGGTEKPNDGTEKPNDGTEKPNDGTEKPNDSTEKPNGDTQTGRTEELSIHFLELGNKYAGDCTLIKIGNTEVLIDAGSRQSSATTIKNYIKDYCTDGVLEYVIATHAHQDHIAGFVGNSSGGTYNGIMYSYQIGTIIQFDRTDTETVTDKGNQTLYGKYVDAVNYAKEKGTNVYTGLQCWNETDGAKRSYELAEGVTMSILYNPFYENKSSDENNYSVCTLFTQGSYNYLFTGDLEEAGEKGLVQHNQLPKCKLFKGGHHGSPTSSNECLLSVIQPEVVCVCCCAGAPEYTTAAANVFPSQAFVDRIAKYTDQVYVTTLATDIDLSGRKWEYTSMNGNIVITSDGDSFNIACSNNMTKLKDTEWFQANRTWNGV